MTEKAIDNKEISEIQKTLKQFVNIIPKTQQALRLFNSFYKIRIDGYRKLKRKISWNMFKSKESKEADRQKILEILRINNDRERKVFLGIYDKAYTELKPHIELLQKNWKKESSELKIMQTYYDDVFASQKDFLDKELLFLNGKLSKEDFAGITNDYFHKVEKVSNNIAAQYSKFYSPIDFEKSFKEKLKSIDPIKEADLLGYLIVFVGLFAGVSNFDHAMPEQLINFDKLPSPALFSEFVLICYVLTKLDAPVKVWAGIKDYSTKLVTAIVS